MKDAVLFDLGNTLVRYFARSEFPTILEQAISRVQDYLAEQGLRDASPAGIWYRLKPVPEHLRGGWNGHRIYG